MGQRGEQGPNPEGSSIPQEEMWPWSFRKGVMRAVVHLERLPGNQVRPGNYGIAAGEQLSSPDISDKTLDSANIREWDVCPYASCYMRKPPQKPECTYEKLCLLLHV